MAKIMKKILHKVAQERNLYPGESMYLDLSSQKKIGYGGSKNWILIQDSEKIQKWSFYTEAKEYLTEKVTRFLNK